MTAIASSRVVEPGPPPILTRDTIVLVYNGVDDRLAYHTGIAVFDRANPTKPGMAVPPRSYEN